MSLVSPQRLREPSSPFITMPPVLPCDMNPSDGCFDVSNPASEKRFFVRADADASYTFLRGILPYMWEIRGRLTPSGGIQYRDSLLVPGTSRAVMRITPGPQMRSAEYFGELVRQYETYPSGPSSEVGRVGWVQWKDNAIWSVKHVWCRVRKRSRSFSCSLTHLPNLTSHPSHTALT
jgi:hypothetical protein